MQARLVGVATMAGDYGPAAHGQFGATSVIITVAIVGLVLYLRNRRPRPLRLERLWVRPALSLFAVASVLYEAPPALTVINILILALGLLFGGALGWQRGRFMAIEVHPETHEVTARISPLGIVFVLALVGLRIWLRQSATSLGALSAVVTDALIVMAGAMMTVQQIEVSLRGRRLLAQAQAASGAPSAKAG
ncbi:MAG TPA: hypothetical protein VG248_04740 [Caulobacteraceae bacterium]|jgi:hypothetical protein|nr:hypothetical protein [Caulobacteraceae bacterium]